MTYPEYPFQQHYLNINNLRLHYLDEGDSNAPPVIMLHGNPSWSFYYRRLVTALKDTHRCIVPDHIGMGLSDKPSSTQYGFTLQERVDDLDKLIQSLQLTQPITLVLHDWGGMIGMAWAVQNPDKVKQFVILNTAAFHLPQGKAIPWQLKLSRLPIINTILNQGLNAFVRGAVKTCVTRTTMAADVAAAYAAPYDNWHTRLAVRRFVEDIPLSEQETAWPVVDETDKKLSQFQNYPMLICWGMNDFVFDQDFLAEWEQRFPQAQIHRFDDAGHYILEDASEDIIPLAKNFLS